MTRQSLLESGITDLQPVGDNVFIIKDEDECVSRGGIVIPDKAQDYKRRGWVLKVGGGYRTRGGKIVSMPYEPGDYLVADRHFTRGSHEQEDEIFHDPVTLLIRGDEPIFFIRRNDCSGKYARFKLPEKFVPLVKKLNPEFIERDINDHRGQG